MQLPFRNQGGFHLIGSGRDKIERPDQLDAAAASCAKLALDGLVVIGGDDSNSNACILAEHFLQTGELAAVPACLPARRAAAGCVQRAARAFQGWLPGPVA